MVTARYSTSTTHAHLQPYRYPCHHQPTTFFCNMPLILHMSCPPPPQLFVGPAALGLAIVCQPPISMLQFVQLSSFANTTAFQVPSYIFSASSQQALDPTATHHSVSQPLKMWTPDGADLSEHLRTVSEYVARCTIWVGPPAILSSDATKKSPGTLFDSITRLPDATPAPKSQMADVFIVSELACIIIR